jgi:hypothetical protein
MLVMTGGRERTAEEFARLFGAAGFRLSGVTLDRNSIKHHRGDAPITFELRR